jgi:hypothetical protein
MHQNRRELNPRHADFQPEAEIAISATRYLLLDRDAKLEARADKVHAFPGRGQQKPEDAEIARLKRELARTKAERDILKKTIGFFVKDPT